MPELSRKLLLVKRDDGRGWNLMVEINGRTMSRQLDESLGERIMTGCIDTVTGILVQSGFVVPSVYEDRRPKGKR